MLSKKYQIVDIIRFKKDKKIKSLKCCKCNTFLFIKNDIIRIMIGE